MRRKGKLAWLAMLVTILSLGLVSGLTAGPVHAHETSGSSIAAACHAASGAELDFAAMTGRGAWICPPPQNPAAFSNDVRADQPVGWLRFEHGAWQNGEPPRYFFTRISRFEAISFAALDSDGSLRTARYLEAEAKPFAAGPVFELPLPRITADTDAILVRIERPHSVPLMTEARLSSEAGRGDWTQFDMVLLALVVGMLILPLLFDISFSIVLREKFVALHAMMVTAMITYVLFAGGLIVVVADVSVHVIAVVGPLFWAVGCGLAGLFLTEFFEPGAQSRLMRRLTIGTGIWTMIMPGFFALQLHATQAFDDRFYFLTFLPALFIMTFAIVEALWRGSRAARFLAVAWTPIILASIERMLRGLGVYSAPSQFDQLLYIAVGIEVVVISLAIADRFLAIRRERDAALTEARMMEQLSAHDPLTGLMNRRAVEARFADLRAQGFDTFALIDLDHFKDINDRFGHMVGDQALIACAKAIAAQDNLDMIAVRLGGEEFVLLLRGPDSTRRAEAMRQAIPRRIASDIPDLDRLVTASMGVLELPREASTMMSFDDLYARADTLLYEAKAAGRNRMLYERLLLFSTRSSPARTANAA